LSALSGWILKPNFYHSKCLIRSEKLKRFLNSTTAVDYPRGTQPGVQRQHSLQATCAVAIDKRAGTVARLLIPGESKLMQRFRHDHPAANPRSNHFDTKPPAYPPRGPYVEPVNRHHTATPFLGPQHKKMVEFVFITVPRSKAPRNGGLNSKIMQMLMLSPTNPVRTKQYRPKLQNLLPPDSLPAIGPRPPDPRTPSS
jgi:hypothetical protein